MIASPPNPAASKALGAFYTPSDVAEFLVAWAVRCPDDVLVDTSSGGGVFLKAAIDRFGSIGGDVAKSVFGVELDVDSHRAAVSALRSVGLPAANVRRGDFFQLALDLDGKVDAVVGNPPFIRYQQFNGSSRALATRLLARAGVRVSDLASSWAPFLIAGASLLRPGGRLAMVVPMELCHAAYGVPVLSFLAKSFRTVQFLSFEQRLFPGLSQDTLLLLADNKDGGAADFFWKHLPSSESLIRLVVPGRSRIPRGSPLKTEAIAAGRQRLIEQFLPKGARELYASLRSHPMVRPLGSLADVGIGYVTGANDFFHLSVEETSRRGIAASFLKKAVFRGRALTGLRFTEADWQAGASDVNTGYLLSIRKNGDLPASVRRYLEEGERQGVPDAYKCRVRSPWYVVPHVHHPDAFLTYMSGEFPSFVANNTDAVAPNTLHVVRSLPLAPMTPDAIAVAWQSSLTSLSVEIEGHAMGGGMLKLEPSEADRVLLALPRRPLHPDVPQTLDVLARHSPSRTIRATVDRLLLRESLGLTDKECQCLFDAACSLRDRRYGRSKGHVAAGSRGGRRNG